MLLAISSPADSDRGPRYSEQALGEFRVSLSEEIGVKRIFCPGCGESEAVSAVLR